MKKASNAAKIEYIPISEIREYENNPRDNDRAVDAVAKSIQRFGVRSPAIVDKDNVLIAGHTRIKAAKQLGMTEFPCVRADDLTKAQAKALRLADNRIQEDSTWDVEFLRDEFKTLAASGFDVGETGFSEAEQYTYLQDDMMPDRPDTDEYREYQRDAEAGVLQATNVLLICESDEDKQYLAAMFGTDKPLRRMYHGDEVRAALERRYTSQ